MAIKIYSPAQLKGMAVKPDGAKPMVDTYPQLANVVYGLGLQPDIADRLLRYLAWFLDPESPMVREFPDPKLRKRAAADQTGYKAEKEHLPATIIFLQTIVRSLEWRVICAKELAFEQYEERVYDTIKTDDVKDTDIITAAQKKDTLITLMQKISQDLPGLKRSFFGDDEELEKLSGKVVKAESVEERAHKNTKR